MNLKIPDFSFIFMIIIRMSQVPKKKIDDPTMMTKKKQKSIRKITRSIFSFLPPCDDKN